MTALSIVRTILKYGASIVLLLMALAAVAFYLSPMGRGTGLIGAALLAPLLAWCAGALWFLHLRRRASATARRCVAAALVTLPVLFGLALSSAHRLERRAKYQGWLTYESDHFLFRYARDYSRQSQIPAYAARHDAVFEQNCAYLGVTLRSKITFYAHDHLAEGFAVPEWNEISADDDQTLGHEMTHIIAFHIAGQRQKSKLIDEGVATLLNHSLKVTDPHRAAWQYIQEYGLPPLADLADSKTFRRHRPQPYYPAASFVGYLIDTHGLTAFRELWTANASYPELYCNLEDLGWARHLPFIPGQRAHFAAATSRIYGCSLDGLDAEWRAWLTKRCGGQR